MKRYLLFSGDMYGENGGWGDFTNSYCELSEAKKAGAVFEWAEIVDSETSKVVMDLREVVTTEWIDAGVPEGYRLRLGELQKQVTVKTMKWIKLED